MLAQFAQSRPKSVSQLRQQISDHTPILNTIADIRGSIYAHRHGVLTPEQVLRRAKLTKGLLRSTVDMATRQLSVLGALAGIESRRELRVEFNRRAKYAQDDARLVIKALAKRGAL
jgi:hypothetical protein